METELEEKKQFSIRPTVEVHERLAEAAAWQGQTLHSFILSAAVREADDVLTSRDRIRLTPEDAEMVLSLLEAEPEPNAALSEAFKKRAEILGE